MQDKPNDTLATKADVANLADDLNTFEGSTDQSFASVWKAIGDLSKKSPADAGAGAADHEHVPAGHAAYSDDRVTGPVAESSAKPTGEEAGRVENPRYTDPRDPRYTDPRDPRYTDPRDPRYTDPRYDGQNRRTGPATRRTATQPIAFPSRRVGATDRRRGRL